MTERATTHVSTLPADRTTAAFTVRALFGRPVHGVVPVRTASVETDGDGRPLRVAAELDLGRIETGNAQRDRDLRKPGLLDLDRCPTLTFRSTGVTATDDGWCVTGELTRGTTVAPVTLTVTRRDDTFVAEGALDRRALAVRAPRFLIGHDLSITVTAPAE